MSLSERPSRQATCRRAAWSAPSTRLPGEARVLDAAERSLTGRRAGFSRRCLPFLGPAFIAAVAYVDPGNFATNIAAGAKFGYTLLWVVLAANLMAMLVQSLSAKLGIATGQNLRRGLPRPLPAAGARSASGSRPRRSRWRPTSPSSLGAALGLDLFSACRSSWPG